MQRAKIAKKLCAWVLAVATVVSSPGYSVFASYDDYLGDSDFSISFDDGELERTTTSSDGKLSVDLETDGGSVTLSGNFFEVGAYIFCYLTRLING